MAYTHADGRIIFAVTQKFQAKAGSAVKAGDLVGNSYAALSAGVVPATQVTTATIAITQAAWAVALEDIAAAAWGWCALAVEIKDPDTISTSGGTVTKGSLALTADIMAKLYLGTGGEATSTAPTASSGTVKQYVGYVLNDDRILLAPTMTMEYILPAVS